jgi:predicted lipoprotein with Yx(FWY)xxD motif
MTTTSHARWLRAACGTALAVLALGAAACGGNDEQPAAAATANATVSVDQVDGVGSVLVDRAGAALYTPDQESDGTIRCKADCLSIWMPLKASGTPTASDDVTGKLGTVDRPDGGKQVTYDGKPLYTFAEDTKAGEVTGDGAKDSFGGTAFTWHAVTTKGTSSGGGSGSSSSY